MPKNKKKDPSSTSLKKKEGEKAEQKPACRTNGKRGH